MIKILKISWHVSIQHIFIMFSVLFPLLKLVKLLEKSVEQMEKVKSISLELIPVSEFCWLSFAEWVANFKLFSQWLVTGKTFIQLSQLSLRKRFRKFWTLTSSVQISLNTPEAAKPSVQYSKNFGPASTALMSARRKEKKRSLKSHLKVFLRTQRPFTNLEIFVFLWQSRVGMLCPHTHQKKDSWWP